MMAHGSTTRRSGYSELPEDQRDRKDSSEKRYVVEVLEVPFSLAAHHARSYDRPSPP